MGTGRCEEASFATVPRGHDQSGNEPKFAEWRFNIRRSNTEPVVRLDLENRGDVPLLEAKAAEVLAIVESQDRL